MMEPIVRVGIMQSDEISFLLSGGYQFNCSEREGEEKVVVQNNKILWRNNLYEELLFEPTEKDASFILRNVLIGVNFHWERTEDQTFQGSLKLIVANQKIVAINEVSVEDYLTSVIASEMSATASLELLKAHAVISRSWLLAQIEKNKELSISKEKYTTTLVSEDEFIRWYDREDHVGFDVCADDHCQRYQGITRAFSNIETVKEAINLTRGQILLDDGKICDARFSKCCGGAVEEFQNCWEEVKHPYLVKLQDSESNASLPDLTQEEEARLWITSKYNHFCNTEDKHVLGQVLNNYDQETTDFYRWQVVYTQKELSDLVRERSGIDFGDITDLIPVQRGTSARLIKLKIVGTKKTLTIGKELEIRKTLSKSHLYSSAFVVEKKEDKFILTGAGWGHGVGLCQIGAAVMGEKGDSYDKILLHYYIGVDIKQLY